MNITKSFLLSIALFLSTLASSAFDGLQIEKARLSLEEKSEVYLSFEKQVLSEEFSKQISVDFIDNNKVYAYANERSFAYVLDNGIPFNVEKHPGEVDFDIKMMSWEDIAENKEMLEWDFYPTYDAYVNMMYQFQEDFPGMCEIHNIGSTIMGRDILFARISSDITADSTKPLFMYTSTIHGDETTGFVLMLRLIDYLLNNYNVNNEITDLLDGVEIWICPNENPDGTYTNNNSTVSGATRGNANGVDLNRNYPNPVNSPYDSEQPEVTAMIDFVNDKNFVMSANFHGGIELVNFPFDSWESIERKHADHNWFEFVSEEYADTAQLYSPSNYMTSFGGTTHGGDWYVVYGSRQDYLNYYRSCREVTIEISNDKLLEPSLLPEHWEYNYRSFLNYIRQSTYGVHGVITDIDTGDPVPAKVTVLEHDKYNSEVYGSIESGYYARPLLAGDYSLYIYGYGYDPVLVEDLSVSNYESIWLDIELKAWPTSVNNSSEEMLSAYIVSNPLTEDSKLVVAGLSQKEAVISIYNMQGIFVSGLYNGIISDNETEISLSHLANELNPGIYIINIAGDKVTKNIKILVL